jgi:predicted NAD-dependent protein-ADP-ribosyltransferase YbiA (DUF1768 family)
MQTASEIFMNKQLNEDTLTIILDKLAEPKNKIIKNLLVPAKEYLAPQPAEVKEEDELISESAAEELLQQMSVQSVEETDMTESVGKVQVESKYYSTDLLKTNPDKIYVFGDNVTQTGKGGQAIIRDEENAFGIPTKSSPNTYEKAYFNDKMYEANITQINRAIEKIKADGRPIVFPKDGLGTGLAKMQEKAPETYAYFKQRLLEEFGFNNDTGTLSTQSSTELVDEEVEIDQQEKTFEVHVNGIDAGHVVAKESEGKSVGDIRNEIETTKDAYGTLVTKGARGGVTENDTFVVAYSKIGGDRKQIFERPGADGSARTGWVATSVKISENATEQEIAEAKAVAITKMNTILPNIKDGRFILSKVDTSTNVTIGKNNIQPSTNSPGPETKINIYAGTRENAELSNFAVRPFIVESENTRLNGLRFNTVEGAYQAAKLKYTSLSLGERIPILDVLKNATGAEAKKIGRQITGLDIKAWDANSSTIMKDLIKESFKQNPDALAKLRATGDATLTHTQDKTKWGTEFPKLLMEVRDELKSAQPSSDTPITGKITDVNAPKGLPGIDRTSTDCQ